MHWEYFPTVPPSAGYLYHTPKPTYGIFNFIIDFHLNYIIIISYDFFDHFCVYFKLL
ncbi:hypothetical protein ANACOL_02545 [Anaerotruncus colihominis DSM 17241]|uniref:Uncharacterized protein n=1 Tax=Anaerotruncus colihominis DSM 17241 TaxID=445972 RepID=B0PCN2_9FIRM|nr:hypothetical protein ANACOL_02545 [Anaerotruncus colihominis DSM 17241]